MDKQKQILEIAEIIAKYISSRDFEVKFITNPKSKAFPFSHTAGVAEALYNAGYRKIPPNAVIINKDENPCLSCPVPEDIQHNVDCSTICGAVRLGIDWQNQCRVLVKENKQLTKELEQLRKKITEGD